MVPERALIHSPDYHFVKDGKGRFLFTNNNVANLVGKASPKDLVGLTDLDITDPERAAKLMAADRRILTTGEPLIQAEEKIGARWFSTSKVALRNPDGEIIGLAGVTRDITSLKSLEGEMEASRQRLEQAVEAMSEALALFAKSGELILCNPQYAKNFPLSADVRRPGAHIKDILRASIRSGERILPPGTDEEAWVQEAADLLYTNQDIEFESRESKWFSLKTRQCKDGAALVVMADITQHRLLANTDPLTGLLNRRAFDTALQSEKARADLEGKPLAVLFADVDHFKRYNDTFGHQMGDLILKRTGDALRKAGETVNHIVARYGGEEFAMLLPGTEMSEAVAIADRFRRELKQNARVTASVGVAMSCPEIEAASFVALADAAMYEAKRNGRDRTVPHRHRDGGAFSRAG